ELEDVLRRRLAVSVPERTGRHRLDRAEQLEFATVVSDEGLVALGLCEQRRSELAHLVGRRMPRVEAGVRMLRVFAPERRILGPAPVCGERAPRGEPAGQR